MIKQKIKEAIFSTLVVTNKESFDNHGWKAIKSVLKLLKEKPELLDKALEE